MRVRDLLKRIIALEAGGGLPDLSQELNPFDWEGLASGLDEDGLIPGPSSIALRALAWGSDEEVSLDIDKAYLVSVVYVVDDTSSVGGGLDLYDESNFVRLVSFDGEAPLGNPAVRSAVIPPGQDIKIELATEDTRLSNIRVFPIG